MTLAELCQAALDKGLELPPDLRRVADILTDRMTDSPLSPPLRKILRTKWGSWEIGEIDIDSLDADSFRRIMEEARIARGNVALAALRKLRGSAPFPIFTEEEVLEHHYLRVFQSILDVLDGEGDPATKLHEIERIVREQVHD